MSTEDTFDAAHSIPSFGPDHKCAKPHGHTYRVTITVSGPLDSRGVVMDFAAIKDAWKPIKAKLDHSNLNDIFGSMSTAECVAVFIFGQLSLAIPMLTAVEVREGASNCARVTVPASCPDDGNGDQNT